MSSTSDLQKFGNILDIDDQGVATYADFTKKLQKDMALGKAMADMASVDADDKQLELDAVSTISASSADNIASLTNMEARLSHVEAHDGNIHKYIHFTLEHGSIF